MKQLFTKKDIERAPMFTVFPGRAVRPKYKRGVRWDIFSTTGPADDVQSILIDLNVDVTSDEPQRDDTVAPKTFDDLDAAVQALMDGLWLCKVPDSPRSKYYRMYVVAGTWRPLELP